MIFHYRFETIHPFVDGNDRVGRELRNYLLTKAGCPRMLVRENKRGKYVSALHSGNTDDYESMMKIFAEILVGERISSLEAGFRQQLEIRVSGSYKKNAQHSLSEFVTIQPFV